jgi:hypothetical protein
VRRYLKRLHFVVLATILIGLYISSSQPYYQQDMRGTISRIVDEEKWESRFQDVSIPYGGKDVSVEEKGTAGFIEFIIRKGVHFTVFALLALSWYGVLRYRLSFAVALPWSAFLSVMTAVFDEWHQTFTPDRTGMVSDVLLDASGSVTMLLIISLIHVYAGRKARNKIGYAQPSYVNKKR